MSEEMLREIDREREELIRLTQDLVRIPSPNPPGDTSEVAGLAQDWLKRSGFDVEWVEPTTGRVNLIATLDTGRGGRHLVMNAHLDVFPIEDESVWELSPWSGEHVAGRIYGRGVTDMKAGAAVFMLAIRALARRADHLSGRATLLLVCDEESFGEFGSRHLLETRAELLGDALLSTEPTGQDLVRVGERGMIWSEVTFTGHGGHGAYPATSPSAVEKAAAFMHDLHPALQQLPVHQDLTLVTADIEERYDQVWPGAAQQVRSVSVNFGTIRGGVRVNMQAALCRLEVDVRIPPGLEVAQAREVLDRVASEHGGSVRVFNRSEPNVTEQEHELVRTVRENVETVVGRSPIVALGPGCTDTRLWRHRGRPAVVFGPKPYGMGAANEFCAEDDLLAMARVHTLSAYEYLMQV